MTQKTVVLLTAGLALLITGCATIKKNEAKNKIDLMTAAGFIPKYADTPEKKAKLDSLDPLKAHTFVKDNETFYVFPDPEGCNCAYVGNQAQYAEYRRLEQEQNLAQEQIQAENWSQDNPPYWGWGYSNPNPERGGSFPPGHGPSGSYQ